MAGTGGVREAARVPLEGAKCYPSIVDEHRQAMLEAWHDISAKVGDERVADLRFDSERLIVDLADGRTIAVPLAWYQRLLGATAAQRSNWTKAGGGFGIHWPDVDEDLSVAGLLRGAAAPRSRRRAAS